MPEDNTIIFLSSNLLFFPFFTPEEVLPVRCTKKDEILSAVNGKNAGKKTGMRETKDGKEDRI